MKLRKTILCYGDSNTWGYIPSADYTLPKARYPLNERWPGILQNLLGNDFYIVEEGLNSRTTNLDHITPPDRNGKTYLEPCLYSHAPIDLVILALGGNDTKTYFNRSAKDIKDGLADLIDVILNSQYGPDLSVAPKILITTSAIPLSFVENAIDENNIYFMKGSIKKCEELIPLCKALAEEKNCGFLDLSEIKPSEVDGVHYDKKGHQFYAELISEKVKELLNK